MHFAIGLAPDGNLLRHQDRAGVEALLHAHDHHTGFRIARHDGALNRRGAPPARQERCVQIEAAEPRRSQDGLGQKHAIGHDDCGIHTKRRERRLFLRIFQRERRAHRQSRCVGEFVHRRLFLCEAAPLAPRGSRVNASNIVRRADQFGQRRHPRNPASP